ncbi:hypothetical protein HPP92_023057 [Vanilla planifolia]|uniref:Uncharacterized protein n=1 Tax=Vanilla planifolia TaxID=51239 RepID=A0A835PYM3_VANPL|nr:hypothetical protein HPP92_023057 [Vanilla planifolia]
MIFERKETSIDRHRVGQSPPPKRRETSMDHHRGLLPLPKRDSSIDHHHGLSSPPHHMEPLKDHDRKPSPSPIRQTSVDNCIGTSSLPKLESSTDPVQVIDAHVLPRHDRSLSSPRPRCASPCRQAENGSGELASPGKSRRSPPPHYLDEVERDKARLPTDEVGIEYK